MYSIRFKIKTSFCELSGSPKDYFHYRISQSSQFNLYSPKSQIAHLSQGALQLVQHRSPFILRPIYMLIAARFINLISTLVYKMSEYA